MEVPIDIKEALPVKVFRPDPLRRSLLAALIVALYAAALPYCYLTAGEPRKAAMLQAQKLADCFALDSRFHTPTGTAQLQTLQLYSSTALQL
eukprot:CAMPEP_0173300136 /NCGR_PEP_ID=MMETSP1143-20121109/17062_1 /TAXON_ID=483371 /ORGANISM="non described non described, Strain CCMP2298" /LENGTH=91 /DNA_ID=CAMNT_0014240493 /DNA_START=416 /DNA_END=691 /DNA_ORIENTATION=-